MAATTPQNDLEAKLAEFEEDNLPDLRAEWRRLFRRPPPHRLSGLSKSTLRRLKVLSDQTATGSANKFDRQSAFKPGTKLLREWNGTTHEVHVLSDGFEWQGRTYTSLSKIAKAITGAHWSGPRFFGLKTRSYPPPSRLREGQDD